MNQTPNPSRGSALPLAKNELSRARITAAKVLFILAMPFTALALLCFAFTVISAIAGTYEGGESFVVVFIYGLLAAPATVLLGISIWLRGWKEAKAARIALALLLGIPLGSFILLAIVAIAGNWLWESRRR